MKRIEVVAVVILLTGALTGFPAQAADDGSFFSYIDYIWDHHPDVQVLRMQLDSESAGADQAEDPIMLNASVAQKGDHGKFYWLTGTVPDSERTEYGIGVSKVVGKGLFSANYLGEYHQGSTPVYGTYVGARLEYPILGGYKEPVNRNSAYMRDIRTYDLAKDLESVLLTASDHYLEYLGLLLERESFALGLDLAAFEFDKAERGTDLKLYKKSTSTPRRISQREWARSLEMVEKHLRRRRAQLELYADEGFVANLDAVDLTQTEVLLAEISLPDPEFNGDRREFSSYEKRVELHTGKFKKSQSKTSPKLLAHGAIGYNNSEFGSYDNPFKFEDASYSVGLEFKMPLATSMQKMNQSKMEAGKKVMDSKMDRYKKVYELRMKKAKTAISSMENHMAVNMGALKKSQDDLAAKQKEFDDKIISRGDLIEYEYYVSVARMNYYESLRALISTKLSMLQLQGRLMSALQIDFLIGG